MATEMGEYLVGAYLKFELGCDVVDYNVRSPDHGLLGLNELDVIGFDFKHRQVYLCEVTTHLKGLLVGKESVATLSKIQSKHLWQRNYAKNYLENFSPTFMFWSPIVARGVAAELGKIDSLKLFINSRYTSAIEKLRDRAKNWKGEANNPAFRVLQIIEGLRKASPSVHLLTVA
jgi:hypothetical protein